MFVRVVTLIIIAPISLLGGAGQARADMLDSLVEPIFSTISWAAGNDNSPTLPTSLSVGITATVSCTISGAQCLNTSSLSVQPDPPDAIEVDLLQDDFADSVGVLPR